MCPIWWKSQIAKCTPPLKIKQVIFPYKCVYNLNVWSLINVIPKKILQIDLLQKFVRGGSNSTYLAKTSVLKSVLFSRKFVFVTLDHGLMECSRDMIFLHEYSLNLMLQCNMMISDIKRYYFKPKRIKKQLWLMNYRNIFLPYKL